MNACASLKTQVNQRHDVESVVDNVTNKLTRQSNIWEDTPELDKSDPTG